MLVFCEIYVCMCVIFNVTIAPAPVCLHQQVCQEMVICHWFYQEGLMSIIHGNSDVIHYTTAEVCLIVVEGQ